MRADGSGLRRVLRSPGWDACPAWSPDGRRLAFHRLVMAVDPEKRVQDIYTVRLDGRDLRRLTVEGSSYKPSWSTGDRIAWHFRQNTLYFNDIFTMKPDGSDRLRLTDNSNNDDPSWSPDGRHVVFSGEDDGDVMDRELFIVEADGSARVQVTDDEPWDIDPVWSPDGRWILYPSFATKAKSFDLYVIRPDGTGRRRVLSARGADYEPDWAPAR
jgi:TolB protein